MRAGVSLVVVCVLLLVPASAQAALGTSTTFAPQNRPYLTSITITAPGLVHFCFGTSGGQAITAPGGGYNPGAFALADYGGDGSVQGAATVTQFNNNCVQATYSMGELPQYTYGTVDVGAVVAIIAGNPVGNLSDSAPLIGSNSNNGTRNFTTGLDLINVLSPGSNRLAFVFDQDVNPDLLPAPCPGPGCNTSDFLFYDGAGALHGNTAGDQQVISISDNVVVVQYTQATDPVNDARIAVLRPGTWVNSVPPPGAPLIANTPGPSGLAPNLASAPIAGAPGAGNTALIESTGAALVNGGDSNQINFTFEGNVALTPLGASGQCFVAITSYDKRLWGEAAVANGNTVTVTFDGMQNFTEQIVRAGIQSPDPRTGFRPGEAANPMSYPAGNCVQSATGAVGNTMGSQPVGGNVGAQATGYTVGPEALGAQRSGGNVTVAIDQRIDPSGFPARLPNVVLLDNQGNPIGGAPSSAAVNGNGSPNDPHSVTFTWDPVAVDAASGIQLRGFPWTGVFDPWPGVALVTYPDVDFDEAFSQPNPMQVFALP